MANPKFNRTRFSRKLTNIKARLEYLQSEYKAERFGVCEGCILSLQNDLTLLYGLMLQVQDDKVRGAK